jgi:hypothetical protein
VDSTSFQGAETSSESLTTAYSGTRSSAFTPGAITIDGIGVKLAGRSSPTGTISVNLEKDSDDTQVAGTEVTLNTTDLINTVTNTEGGWYFFKFASPVTLAAATAYQVAAKVSSNGSVNLSRDGTADNISRYLRTTTTQAPAAGDDMIITKEWTAAGTGTARSVTMNETAATDYGSAPTAANGLLNPGIAIGNGGTLTFKDTSAANPYLRLSNSLIVYNGGTLNIGTTGTPIPRDSIAVLEFDCGADGDYGCIGRNGSTISKQGLSRTSGKLIDRCKLSADPAANLLSMTGNVMNITSGVTHALTGLADPYGGFLAARVADTAANAVHRVGAAATVVSDTTQIFTVWLARGVGTNNRFVRMYAANAATPTTGFFADVDLQAGTIGTCTALGTGTATSSSIVAFGGGFVCSIVGKVSSGSATTQGLLFACSASGTTTYLGDATDCFHYYQPAIFTASSAPAFSVDADTGWLADDLCALAATSRTVLDCQAFTLASGAGASTLTPYIDPNGVYSGTSPTQAEIILLTRNVKIRGLVSNLPAYVYFDVGSVGDCDWVEFYNVGDGASTKRGVEINMNALGPAVNVSIQNCSIHDCEDGGFNFNINNGAGPLTTMNFSNNVLWSVAQTLGPACQVTAAVNATNWVIDSNIIIKVGNSSGWTLNDVGGTFTNNTVVGNNSSVGFFLGEAATIGTMTGNVCHCNTSHGWSYGTNGISGVAGTVTSWRNTGAGINISVNAADVTIESPVLFGNSGDSLVISGNADVWLKSPIFNGDTTFATTNGIRLSSNVINLLIDDGDFSTVSGIKTAHTLDIVVSALGVTASKVIMRNTKLGAPTEVSNQSGLSSSGFISSEKHDQTAGNHKTWMKNGTVNADSSIFNTISPSMRMTPLSASAKLESAPQFRGILVPVENGNAVDIAVNIRKSSAGDGAAYNGAQPRLIQKANPALGQSADVVIATYSAGTGAWNAIGGTSSVPTDDGAWEFVVDCDGTAGWVNWSVN